MAKTGAQWNFQDKNQRVSRVNSEFLRNSISQHMCQDGSVNLPSQEVDAIIRNLSRKEKKISKMWWALGFAAIFSVALFALTFASALSANEASKESHVSDGTLEDLDGNTVAVRELESYGTLFELPRFDSRTLAHLNHLTLTLSEDRDATFEIASAIKENGCGQVVRLFSTDGSEIVIDADNGLAVATVAGHKYAVRASDIENERRSLFQENDVVPRLYSGDEFFSGIHGLDEARRLGAESVSGWAIFALKAGEAVIEYHESNGVNGPSERDSVFMQLTIFEADGEQTDADLFVINETDFRYQMSFDGGVTEQVVFSKQLYGFYAKKVRGEWTECGETGMESAGEDGRDATAHVNTLVGMCGTIVQVGDVIIDIKSVQFDVDESVIDIPGDACNEVYVTPYIGDIAASEGGRLRRQLSNWNSQYAQNAYDVYSRTTCTSDYGAALIEGNNVAFRGSDNFNNWWKTNIWQNVWDRKENVAKASSRTERNHGRGFYEYVEQLAGCIHEKTGGVINTVSGHSLGGAAATVFVDTIKNGHGFQRTWSTSNTKVETYEAPKSGWVDCVVPGKRYFHEYDTITRVGPPGANHNVAQTYEVKTKSHCFRHRWWCRDRRYMFTLKGGASCTASGGSIWPWNWNVWDHHKMKRYVQWD